MRKPIIVTAEVLLMVLTMAADSPPAGTGDGIAIESAEAIFGSPLQEPAITTVPQR